MWPSRNAAGRLQPGSSRLEPLRALQWRLTEASRSIVSSADLIEVSNANSVAHSVAGASESRNGLRDLSRNPLEKRPSRGVH